LKFSKLQEQNKKDLYWLIEYCVRRWKYKKLPRPQRVNNAQETQPERSLLHYKAIRTCLLFSCLLSREAESMERSILGLFSDESRILWPLYLKITKCKTFNGSLPLQLDALDHSESRRSISTIFGFYRTCRFSQLFDLLSRAQTLSSKLRTFRLVLVRLPRYFLGELFSEHEPSGDLLRFFRDLFRNISLVLSGFSSFRRICVRRPTSNSSTLWLIPTDVSINLQS